MTILSNRKVILNEYIESDKPIKNLKNAFLGINNEEISNYRFKKSKIITGYADFLQIYVSHAFFVANSLISLNLSIFNIANFALNNIKINIIFNESAEIFPSDSNPRTIIIDELQGNKQKNIFFTLKINSIDIIHIYFEIKINEDEIYKFRSLPYKIGLCNLILPNKIIQLSQEFFFENWYNIRFQMQFKCHLIKSVKEIIKIFEKKNFSTCFLNFDSKNENENKNNEKVCISLGLLGISWDGYVIAGKLSQIFMNKNSQICFFELKTNKLRLIERIKSEIEYFLEDLSDENLNLII